MKKKKEMGKKLEKFEKKFIKKKEMGKTYKSRKLISWEKERNEIKLWKGENGNREKK